MPWCDVTCCGARPSVYGKMEVKHAKGMYCKKTQKIKDVKIKDEAPPEM